jgi:hypothetical protein
VGRNPTPPSLRRGQVHGFPRTLTRARQSAAAAADPAKAGSVSLESRRCRVTADSASARTNWCGSFAREEATFHNSLGKKPEEIEFLHGNALKGVFQPLIPPTSFIAMEHQLRSPEGRRRYLRRQASAPLQIRQVPRFSQSVPFARGLWADTLTLALPRHDSRLTDPAFAGSVSPYPRRDADTPSRQVPQPLLLRC